jgi:hypothetical protein
MEANAVAEIDGIIPTLCTSRKDETATNDALTGTAARPLESNYAVLIFLKLANSSFFLVSP